MIQVVPAIIPYTKKQLEEEIKKVADFAPLVQVDITDGLFTPIKTWPYNNEDIEFFNKLRNEEIGWPEWQKVDIEVHLMINNPEEVIMDWIKTGVSTIIIHIEATNDFKKIVDVCRENFISIGVAIKPKTSISLLDGLVEKVDFIQCMGNDSLGKHGVELDEESIMKITKLHELYPEKIIAIDIGVNNLTAKELVRVGVSKFVSGGAILNSDNPKDEYFKLKSF